MRLIAFLFQSFFRLPIVSNIITSTLLFFIPYFILTIGLVYFNKYYPFIAKDSIILISFLMSASLAITAFWNWGQKIGTYALTKVFAATIFFIPISYLSYKFYKVNNVKLLIAHLLFFLIVPPILKLLNKRKKTILNKTLSEIDNFGVDSNGKKDTKLAGDLFEEYIRDCFRLLGYEAYTTTDLKNSGKGPKGLKGLSGDGGADVIATSNKLGRRIVIQCKHYSNTVGVEACYQAYGALKVYEGTEAMVITNNFFTEEAKFNAEQNGVQLMDRFKLTQFIAEVSKYSEDNKTELTFLQKIKQKKAS